MTKKKVKAKSKKPVEEKKLLLTEVEFLKIELGQAKVKLAIMEQEKIERKIEELVQKFGLDKSRVAVHNNTLEAKKAYTEVVRAVEGRLGIPKFEGYDPDTLEVK